MLRQRCTRVTILRFNGHQAHSRVQRARDSPLALLTPLCSAVGRVAFPVYIHPWFSCFPLVPPCPAPAREESGILYGLEGALDCPREGRALHTSNSSRVTSCSPLSAHLPSPFVLRSSFFVFQLAAKRVHLQGLPLSRFPARLCLCLSIASSRHGLTQLFACPLPPPRTPFPISVPVPASVSVPIYMSWPPLFRLCGPVDMSFCSLAVLSSYSYSYSYSYSSSFSSPFPPPCCRLTCLLPSASSPLTYDLPHPRPGLYMRHLLCFRAHAVCAVPACSFICIRTRMRSRIRIRIRMFVYSYSYIRIRAHVGSHIRVFVLVFLFSYSCLYVH